MMRKKTHSFGTKLREGGGSVTLEYHKDGTYSGTYRREVHILSEVRTKGRNVPVASDSIGGP